MILASTSITSGLDALVVPNTWTLNAPIRSLSSSPPTDGDGDGEGAADGEGEKDGVGVAEGEEVGLAAGEGVGIGNL
jgi:hypothetical protein